MTDPAEPTRRPEDPVEPAPTPRPAGGDGGSYPSLPGVPAGGNGTAPYLPGAVPETRPALSDDGPPYPVYDPSRPYPVPEPGSRFRPRPGVGRPTGREVRIALIVLVTLAALGALAGIAWMNLSPRLAFKVVDGGQAYAVDAESEAYMAGDGWFFVVTAGIGLVAAIVCWVIRPARGWLTLLALAAGGVVGAVLTRIVGQALAGPPSADQLRQVGAIVLAPVKLRATAFLIAEAFTAVLVYVVLAGFASRDDLGVPERAPSPEPLPDRA